MNGCMSLEEDLVERENRLWLFRSLVRGAARGDGNLISTSYLPGLRQVMDGISQCMLQLCLYQVLHCANG